MSHYHRSFQDSLKQKECVEKQIAEIRLEFLHSTLKLKATHPSETSVDFQSVGRSIRLLLALASTATKLKATHPPETSVRLLMALASTVIPDFSLLQIHDQDICSLLDRTVWSYIPRDRTLQRAKCLDLRFPPRWLCRLLSPEMTQSSLVGNY
jgi:hypothetical protein